MKTKTPINLSVSRKFSDLITATFNFIVQEFRPYFRCYCVFILPFVLLQLVVSNFLLERMFDPAAITSYDSFSFTLIQFLSYLTQGLCMCVLMTMSLCYMKVYHAKYLAGDSTPLTVKEVWNCMKKKIGGVFVWNICYGIIVMIGLILLIIPGIYLLVGLIYGVYLYVIKDNNIGDSIFTIEFSKGEWWNTFLYSLLLGVITYVLSFLFLLPYTIITALNLTMGMGIGMVWVILSLFVSNFLSYFINGTVGIIGVGVKFFSIIEEREHPDLIRKIDEIGVPSEEVRNETEN